MISFSILPQSAIGKAIADTLRVWPRLVMYIDNSRFRIDNNPIENTIRPVALGKKNYLFAGSHNAT
ncbi:MAG: transposase [Chloroflexi bacterium]|nr:transposase [Chloroflexota bacterium]